MANKQLEQVQAHKHLYRKIDHGSQTYLLLLQNQTGCLDYLNGLLGRGRKLYLLVIK